ncbi:IclR family transcriptional regulator [Sulfobacillus harzensis]|uniref:Glycerol operon regulatory protein n=1 Tax=Sulfobacillus harzensis TaxID=2729629 RepID=A0A7Y0L6H0_9FIRM|nr:IclR family transcriptional regulator [Sulfobacillus harzensis]NMP24126.1 IclR family transcriptional regulator [Sulfobacillus harzensis]
MRDVNISPIRAVRRAIDVLNAFTTEEPELTVEQVSEKTHLPKATVYRILYTMETTNLIRYDEETGRYRLGIQFLSYAGLVTSTYDVVRESEEVLIELHQRIRQTILMCVVSGDELLYVFRRENAEGLKFSSSVGQRRPIPYGVVGKVALAYLPPAQLDRILAQPIEATTPYSLTDPEELRRRIHAIRQDGFYIDIEETTIGVCGVAAPVLDITDRLAASVGIIGPTVQLTDHLQNARDYLLEATARISQKMGHHPSATTTGI